VALAVNPYLAVMKKLKNWWLLMIAGALLLALGIFALVSPWRAYVKMVHYGGVVLLLNGILLIGVSYTSHSSLREKHWILVESLMDLFFGVILLFNPLLSFIAFPIFIGYWMIGKGILKTIASVRLAGYIRGWLLICLAGLLSIGSGLLVVYNPLERSDGITLFVGAFGLIMGALYIFDSLRWRKMTDTVNMMF
jgi:uncharacterized membrane protein HdeD (DUF308 family)